MKREKKGRIYHGETRGGHGGRENERAFFKRKQKLSNQPQKVTVTFFFQTKAKTFVSAPKSDSHPNFT